MVNHDKYFVIKNFWCTCTSVEMLKGYMVRERLGTPSLDVAQKGSALATDLSRTIAKMRTSHAVYFSGFQNCVKL